MLSVESEVKFRMMLLRLPRAAHPAFPSLARSMSATPKWTGSYGTNRHRSKWLPGNDESHRCSPPHTRPSPMTAQAQTHGAYLLQPAKPPKSWFFRILRRPPGRKLNVLVCLRRANRPFSRDSDHFTKTRDGLSFPMAASKPGAYTDLSQNGIAFDEFRSRR